MKHLGNCDYEEFMAQAMQIREPLEKWIEATGAAGIRKKHLESLPENATAEQNNEALRAFLAEMEVAAFRKCPELTQEVLRIATFSDAYDENRKGDYIDAALIMYSDRVVRDFFTLSMRPKRTTSSKR